MWKKFRQNFQLIVKICLEKNQSPEYKHSSTLVESRNDEKKYV